MDGHMRFRTVTPPILSNAMRLVAAIGLCWITSANGAAQADPPADSGTGDRSYKVRIAALHVASDTGARYFKGIDAALAAHELREDVKLSRENVLIESLEYSTERDGVLELRRLITTGKYDVILGPTESGVLVAAMSEYSEWPVNNPIPVISPLVTVQIPIDKEGWFFMTNLGVSGRAHAVYDYLSKYWLRSIAVLYADTEFGRQAEDAFRKQLDERQGASYQALPYDINSDDRRELRMVLNARPEAVGIFGQRDYIEVVCKEFRPMNTAGFDYAPVIFSLIDVSDLTLATDMNFVSVVPADPRVSTTGAVESKPKSHEVFSLAKDTTTLVLNTFESLDSTLDGNREELRKDFRDRFALALTGTAATADDKTPTLRFANFRNHTPAFVFQRRGKEWPHFDLNDTVGWSEKLSMKYHLIGGRFGLRPFIYVGLCLLAVIITNFMSLYRWEKGRWWWVLLRPRAYLLFVGNVLLVVCLIVTFAETGAIRYDSFLPMFALALGPAAFLRSAVQAMPAGKTVDAGKIYDRVTRWLTKGIVLREMRKQRRRASYLGYYNSLADLEDEVKSTIKPDLLMAEVESTIEPELHAEREQQLADFTKQLGKISERLEKKRFCARYLLRAYSWKQLKRRGFIPERLDKNELDADWLFRRAVQHCINNKTREADIDKLLEEKLSDYPNLKTEYEQMIRDEQQDRRAKLWVKIQFLYIRFGSTVNEESLIEKDLLPPPRVPWWSLSRWWIANASLGPRGS